ncbi:hypothetical protein L2E82_50104 [Cichorium intybus]|nr:hypothetical protein L2E82_50104 [Cichorium intybus]
MSLAVMTVSTPYHLDQKSISITLSSKAFTENTWNGIGNSESNHQKLAVSILQKNPSPLPLYKNLRANRPLILTSQFINLKTTAQNKKVFRIFYTGTYSHSKFLELLNSKFSAQLFIDSTGAYSLSTAYCMDELDMVIVGADWFDFGL